MQQEFQHLLHYCKANKLAVNFRKSRYVVISSQLKKSNITVPNIEQKDYIKYLGIYIDKNLNSGNLKCYISIKFQKTWE